MVGIDRLCRQARVHFSDRADGIRTPGLAGVAVELHLRFCPMCRRTYAALVGARDALAALRDEDPPRAP